MKRILILSLCLLVTGCASSTRLTRLKDKGENVVTVEAQGNISEIKEIIREIAKELRLIERPSAETENFMLVNTNKFKGSLIQAVSGGLGAMAYVTQLGFFFDYDKEKNITKVTISEEVSSFGDPKRFIFADKIKFKQLVHKQKNE